MASSREIADAEPDRRITCERRENHGDRDQQGNQSPRCEGMKRPDR